MTEETKTRKPKKTLVEQREVLMAKLAIIEAKENGTYKIERDGAQALKFALKRRAKMLHDAQVLVNGRAKTAKSPPMATIADKITNCEERLERLKAGQDRAQGFLDNLPADIKLLEGLVTLSESGETVDIPTDLYKLGDETEPELEVRVAIENAENA